MSNELEQSIAQIREYKPHLQDLLMASPYDPGNSLDGLLTKEVFMAKLYQPHDGLENLEEELKRRMTVPVFRNRITMVAGYNGVGKTTFLWHFQDDNEQLDHRYINCDSSDDVPKINDPITRVLRHELAQFDHADQLKCLRAIASNSGQLATVFSAAFLECVSGLADGKADQADIERKLRHVKMVDALVLYFMMLFYTPLEKDLRIIYFDNLDATSVDFLSGEFKDAFDSALFRAMKLSLTKSIFELPILFNKNYRFVLCLRDAVSSIYNAHMNDRTGPTVTCMPYRVSLPVGFYKGVMAKRLAFVQDILGQDPLVERVRTNLLRFIGDRAFVEPALVELFNGDYRKLAYALLKTADAFRDSHVLLTKDKYYRYGMRAVLLRGVVQFVAETAYLRNFEELEWDVNKQVHRNFHHLRMILNVLLNNSRGSVQLHSTNPTKLMTDCSLYDLIVALQGVYPVKESLDTVSECFRFHEANWVQLLSIYGKPVYGPEAFRDEEELFLELNRLNGQDKFTLDHQERKRRDEIVLKLDKIKLKIAAAGISYLKYLNTHFEYYSALESPTSSALFQIDPLRKAEPQSKAGTPVYECDLVIDRVYQRFKRHSEMMASFYNTTFKGRLGFTPRTFRLSDFSFKYTGDRAGAVGMFHSSRVAYSHIDYLQTWRLHAVGGPRLDDQQVQDLNKRLIPRIERYLVLLEASYDDSTAGTCKVMQDCVSTIKGRDYLDRTTRIEASPRMRGASEEDDAAEDTLEASDDLSPK